MKEIKSKKCPFVCYIGLCAETNTLCAKSDTR